MKLIIPMPPNRANARGHWRTHHRAKKRYWKVLDSLQLLGEHDGFRVPPPPKKPWSRATATATMYGHNLMDPFNAGARMKWVEDWLVTRGYIEDDRLAVLHWTNIPEQRIDRKNPRIEMTLEEVGDHGR